MRRNDEPAFWRRVQVTPACWEWQGQRMHFGHGRVAWRGQRLLAHRLAWELCRGPIPDGLIVRHKCDNPPCVNPDHLELGTQADNVRDKMQRGRHINSPGESCGHSKLTWEQVIEIRRAYAAGEANMRELADRYGVTKTTTRGVIRGRTWKVRSRHSSPS